MKILQLPWKKITTLTDFTKESIDADKKMFKLIAASKEEDQKKLICDFAANMAYSYLNRPENSPCEFFEDISEFEDEITNFLEAMNLKPPLTKKSNEQRKLRTIEYGLTKTINTCVQKLIQSTEQYPIYRNLLSENTNGSLLLKMQCLLQYMLDEFCEKWKKEDDITPQITKVAKQKIKEALNQSFHADYKKLKAFAKWKVAVDKQGSTTFSNDTKSKPMFNADMEHIPVETWFTINQQLTDEAFLNSNNNAVISIKDLNKLENEESNRSTGWVSKNALDADIQKTPGRLLYNNIPERQAPNLLESQVKTEKTEIPFDPNGNEKVNLYNELGDIWTQDFFLYSKLESKKIVFSTLPSNQEKNAIAPSSNLFFEEQSEDDSYGSNSDSYSVSSDFCGAGDDSFIEDLDLPLQRCDFDTKETSGNDESDQESLLYEEESDVFMSETVIPIEKRPASEIQKDCVTLQELLNAYIKDPRPQSEAKIASVNTATAAILPMQAVQMQDAPKQMTPAQDAPKQTTPVQDAPKQTTPVQDAPKQTTPVQDAPKQTTPVQDAPKQTTPAPALPTRIAQMFPTQSHRRIAENSRRIQQLRNRSLLSNLPTVRII